jgi:hypothetical protein
VVVLSDLLPAQVAEQNDRDENGGAGLELVGGVESEFGDILEWERVLLAEIGERDGQSVVLGEVEVLADDEDDIVAVVVGSNVRLDYFGAFEQPSFRSLIEPQTRNFELRVVELPAPV